MTDAPPTAGRRWLPVAVLLLAAIGVGGYLVSDQFLRGADVAGTQLDSRGVAQNDDDGIHDPAGPMSISEASGGPAAILDFMLWHPDRLGA
jgi:hypothetical protein